MNTSIRILQTKLLRILLALWTMLALIFTVHAQVPTSPDWSEPFSFDDSVTSGVYPSIASNGQNWIATYSGSFSNTSDLECMYSFSEDGNTWTAPKPINSDWSSDTLDDLHAQVSGSANGLWIATWERGTTVVLSISSDNGNTWSEPQEHAPGKNPSIAFLGGSEWLLCYADTDLYLSRSENNGSSWLTPSTIPGKITMGTWGKSYKEYNLHSPQVFGKPGASTVYVGFEADTISQSGLGMPAEHGHLISGFKSEDKGATFPGVSSYYFSTSYYVPFAGSKSLGLLATSEDYGTDIFWTINGYFVAQIQGEFAFSLYHDSSAYPHSSRVAVDTSGHWMGLTAVNTAIASGETTTRLLIDVSKDSGASWETSQIINTTGIAAYGVITTAELDCTNDGQFITVLQLTDNAGNSSIWLSNMNRFIADTDGDSVLDEIDQCPGTPEGDAVDASGCSILQNCQCEGPREGGLYQNKNGYKKCIKQQAKQFVKESRLTKKERKALLKQYKTVPCTPSASD